MKKFTSEKQQLQKYINNGNVEIRCIDKISPQAIKTGRPIIWSSVFNDCEAMVKQIKYAESKSWDVYQTINPLQIPATNENLKPYKRTAKDTDVSSIKTIFFDFDAVRETGTASTDEHVNDCAAVAIRLDEYLYAEFGWSKPTFALSGNGAHLLYQTHIDVEFAKNLTGLYAGLAKRFNTDTVDFDVSVKNPARIARVIGTINRKSGTRSCLNYSDEVTDGELILKACEKLTPPKPQSTWVKPVGHSEEKAGSYIKNWDIVGTFVRNGLYRAASQDTGKHFVECPWISEHSSSGTTDTVVYEGEWAQFHCSHSHCSNRGIKDVIELFGGNS